MSDLNARCPTFTALIKQRRRIEREVPRRTQGWWADVCPGKTLQLRAASAVDIARCFIREGESRDPTDYLCELPADGALVHRSAISRLIPNH